MVQERFFYLLQHISKKEFKQFKRHLNILSDNRKTRSIAISQAVWGYIQKNPTASTKALHQFKVQLFKTCFSASDKYDNLILNKHLHYLSQQLEEYLILQEVRTNKIKRQEILMSVAKSRRMVKEYFNAMEKQRKRRKKEENRSFEYLHQQFFFTYQDYFHPEIDKAKKKYKGIAIHSIVKQANKELDLFYWTTKYRLACEMVLRNSNISGLEDDSLELPFSEEAAPVLYMYQSIYTLFKTRDSTLYPKVKQKVLTHLSKVNNEEQNSIIILLYNFNGMQLGRASNVNDVYQEMISIAKVGFEHNIFGREYSLGENLFIGFYQIARIIEPNWADILLKKYIPMLSPIHQNNTLNFCQAFYAFENKDFDEALDMLQQIEYNNFNYLLRARVLLIMCYYELKEVRYVDVENEAINFGRHLKTNKSINQNVNLAYLNFTIAVKQLYNYKKIGLNNVENFLKNTPALASRKWLLEKINILKIKKTLN